MSKKPYSESCGKFWDTEYKTAEHLKLSEKPSEDLMKFTRWLERKEGRENLNSAGFAVDLGCGNGRNLIYLAKNFGMKGVGYDISEEALRQAKIGNVSLPLNYEKRSVAEALPLPNQSANLALDMMTSHFLSGRERAALVDEIARVLKPRGWFFWKTFLADEDKHAKRLLQEHPARETGSYIHPKIGLAEHVFTETEIEKALVEKFIIHKMIKSYGHLRHAPKRRSVSIYAQKLEPIEHVFDPDSANK